MNKKKIQRAMQRQLKYCRDSVTGELNHTLLAEQVADELDLYIGDDFEIPQEVFDLASEFK